MKTQRAPFLPVTSDVDDDRLERLAEQKGVGSLVKTTPNKHGAGEGATATMLSSRDGVDPASAAAAATPRSRMK
jgi:hypothetical protein